MNLAVRPTTTSDLPGLIDLFERSHARYASFAERSVEDFCWRYLDRPDIGMDGVIVVEDPQQRVIGYAVVGTSGTIWEFGIDPDTNRRAAADLLITEAERRLVRHGVDEVVLHAPVEDLDMAGALLTAGYGARPPIQQYLSFTNLPAVVEEVLIKHEKALPRGLTAVEFHLSNPRQWHPERFSVSLPHGGTGPSRKRSVTIATSVENLVGMIVGAIHPGRAIATGQLRIAPLSELAKGLRLLKAMRLRDPFFFAAGDVI